MYAIGAGAPADDGAVDIMPSPMQVRPSVEPHPGLTHARPVRAVGPGADREALRCAYLDLLKLALCDLTGPATMSVGRLEGGVAASRELTGDGLRLRAAGMDWPLQGLTMVGLRRLDDLQRCVETLVHDDVEGDLIEAGSWRGGASILMRATLDTLGDDTRTVYVADSFEGFPEAEEGELTHDEWAAIDYLAVSLEEVRQSFARLGLEHRMEFVRGFFADTMPQLRGRRWSLVRVDGDTYEATRVVLEELYPSLSTGGYVVIDDYGALDECRQAVDEFRAAHGIGEPLEEVDWTGVRWRRVTEPAAEQPAPSDPPAAPARPAGRDRAETRIPTSHELGLVRELDELRERLQRAEQELATLRDSRAVRLARAIKAPLRGSR
jgi:O-methyltransferase